ncbi:VanZ like protein [Homoserinimonas aerilata]|uniref:VanZ like protein n=1 Tax=Homoserinimonas aerilata TaxID=1162970 RepID=A0A542YH06_9MICO|nr:VanZ family protein [Homoserinimonas aerilata]TQL47380.1 VanZ like protein [Homoserinimonas aerilata]
MLRRHPVLSLATFGYLAVIGWVTLGPQPLDGDGRRFLWTAIRWLQDRAATEWVTYDGVEFTANVLMFVPIGLMLVLLLGRGRWWLAVLLAVVLTVGIETTQLFLRDRVPDARDLVANSIGGFVGVLAALVLTWPKARALRRAELRA